MPGPGLSLRGLLQPLPEGSKRSRSPVDSLNTPVAHSSHRRARHSSSLSSQPMIDTVAVPLTDTVVISVDGACRGNGGNQTSAACGVFCMGWESPHTYGRLLHLPTNNAAEIAACIEAHRVIHRLLDVGYTSFQVRMDSMHVIATITSGRILQYQQRDHLTNSALWVELRNLHLSLRDRPSISLEYIWVPRWQNKESDEVANAVLDNRAPDTSVASVTVVHDITTNVLLQLLDRLRKFRYPMLRHIPHSLLIQWTSLVQSVLLRSGQDPTRQRLLFILLPTLVGFHISHVRSNEDFKSLRSVLTLLHDDSFLNATVMAALQFSPHPSSHVSSSSAARITALARQGLFHRCLPSDSSIHLATPADLTHHVFPHKDSLPDRLITTCQTPVLFSELLVAAKRLKAFKSPTLSGWSREILLPLLYSVGSDARQALCHIFTAFTNDMLTDTERDFLRTGVLIFLKRREMTKIRGIHLMDTLLKVSWNVVLRSLAQDPFFDKSPQLAGLKMQCQSAILAIQYALDMGLDVIRMDAVNAFPTVSRFDAFEYLRGRPVLYQRAYALVNMLYASPSFVHYFEAGAVVKEYILTTGTMQGCVSGPWFYKIATALRSKPFFHKAIQIVDDMYCFSIPDAVEVVKSFAQIDQVMNGPKLTIISRRSSSSLPLELSSAAWCSGPIKVLGGFVSATMPSTRQIDACLKPLLQKWSSRFEALLNLDCSLQIKFLILASISWDALYYAEVCSPTFAVPLFDFFDELQYSTLCTLGNIPGILARDSALHLHFFAPIEEGGCGLLPFASLAPYLRARSMNQCHSLICRVSPFHVPPPPSTTTPSLLYSWHESFREGMVGLRLKDIAYNDSMFLTESSSSSWLRSTPSNRFLDYSDELWLFAFQSRLGFIKPFAYICPLRDVNLASLDHRSCHDHVFSCAHCAGSHNTLRHERVVHAIKRVLQFHSVSTERCPSGVYPNIGNRRGGPDLLIRTNQTYIVDVSITGDHIAGRTFNRLRSKVALKFRTYAQMQKDTAWEIFPFILNTRGVFSPKTLELIEQVVQYAQTPVLRRSLLLSTQHEMFLGILQGLDKLRVRHLASEGSFQIPVPLEAETNSLFLTSSIAVGGLTTVPSPHHSPSPSRHTGQGLSPDDVV